MQLITSLADVNPDWLTDVLRRASVLGGGSVADIAPEVASTSFCTIARLRATYSPDGACPERLSLKFSLPTHPVSTPESGAEVLFYRDVAPQMSGPLARCFDAEFSVERHRLHVLLEDALPPSVAVGYGASPQHLVESSGTHLECLRRSTMRRAARHMSSSSPGRRCSRRDVRVRRWDSAPGRGRLRRGRQFHQAPTARAAER